MKKKSNVVIATVLFICIGVSVVTASTEKNLYYSNNIHGISITDEAFQSKKMNFKVMNKLYAWDIQSVSYLGAKNGGFNMRVSGIAIYDIERATGATSVNVGYYTKDGQQQFTGAYYFPGVKKGENFTTDIVVFLPAGMSPSTIGGLIFASEIDYSNLHDRTDNASGNRNDESFQNKTGQVVSANKNIKYGEVASGQILNGEADEPPLYPGGNNAYNAFYAQNVRYPAIAQDNGMQGRVMVYFLINKEGKISNINAVPDSLSYLCEAGKRAVEAMPDWRPATLNGEPVEVYYGLFFSFTLK